NRVCPVLHLQPRLAGLAAGVVDDLSGLALGELDDLGLGSLANGLLTGLAENSVALALRLGQHLLAFLDDPAGLLDLLGDRRPHLVEDVVDLLAVDADLVGQRDGLRVVHEVVQLVDQDEYIHGFSESTEGFGPSAISIESEVSTVHFRRTYERSSRVLTAALQAMPSGLARTASPSAPARAPARPFAAAPGAAHPFPRSSGGRSPSAPRGAAAPRPQAPRPHRRRPAATRAAPRPRCARRQRGASGAPRRRRACRAARRGRLPEVVRFSRSLLGILRGPGPAVREELLEPVRNALGHELVHVSAE